jgi:hypothetical protein
MLARSRSKGWILAAFVVLIVGVAWRLRSAHESGVPDPPVPVAATVSPPSPSDAAPPLERAPTDEVEVSAAPLSTARESAPTDPDFELKQAIWIEGQVIIPPGTPNDEHVEVIASGSRFETRPMHRCPIAADGTFRVAFARATEIGTFEISARYLYFETTPTVWMSNASSRVMLKPALGGRVRGRLVVPLAGLRWRDALVGSSVKVTSVGNKILCSTRVDQNLAFEFEGVHPNSGFRVQLDAAGFLEPDTVFSGVQRGAVLTIEVDLKMAARILGVVVDPAGQPIHRAIVRASRPGTKTESAAFEVHVNGVVERDMNEVVDLHTVTDLEGAFELSHLEPGSWALEASAETWAAAPEAKLELLPGQSIERLKLVLRRAGRIAGHVLRTAQKPAAHVQVDLISVPESDSAQPDWRGRLPSTETDAFGTFEFEGLSPGSYRLEAHFVPPAIPTGRASLSGITLREGGDIDDLVLHLEPLARIEGTVFGPDGTPVDGARVWWEESDHIQSGSNTVVTDAAGHFALQGVQSGEGTLGAEKERLVSSIAYSVRSGETLHIEIRLEAGTYVVIHVSGGKRASSVVISVEDDHGRPVQTRRLKSTSLREPTGDRSDPKHSVLARLPVGRYTIRAAAADGWTDRRDLEISGQDFASVTFDVPE